MATLLHFDVLELHQILKKGIFSHFSLHTKDTHTLCLRDAFVNLHKTLCHCMQS